MKKSKNLNTLALVGGLAVAGYLAYETNLLGLKDMIDNVSLDFDAQDIVGEIASIGTGGKRYSPYPFNYPYPPTQTPQYAGPTTQSAAHYKMAGPPNIRIQGAGLLPNPNLWVDKGGIMTSGKRALPSAINYGPYKFEAPIFQSQRYPIPGTNLSYPFMRAPFCPPDQFSGQDGRCYPTPLYP